MPSAAALSAYRHIYEQVGDKLAGVDDELLRRTECGIGNIDRLGRHLIEAGGKRLRPAMLLLVSKMLGVDRGDRDVRYAAIVEMLHIATLIHDDVIDEARTRRGRPSLNAMVGNTMSVLYGDLLFTRAIGQLIDEGNITILRLLCDAMHSMVIGEILELDNLDNLAITRDVAFDIISRKTAALFSAACALPAYLDQDGPLPEVEPLRMFGYDVGVAFQLVDDLLDYTSTDAELGKPAMCDICEGKVTMPLLLALPAATSLEREQVATVLRERAFDTVSQQQILAIARGGLDATRALAADYCHRAAQALGPLPPGSVKDALLETTSALAERTR